MRLPRQLFLVSLLTLALPWAGCEYIREMEKTLRQGQQAALTATAQAVAARLASDPETYGHIASASGATATTSEIQPIYAHPLRARPIRDGYDDDWRKLGLNQQQITSPDGDFQVALLAGKYGDELFLFARVRDPAINYHNPQQPREASDQVTLHLKPPLQVSTRFNIYTGAPGQVTVVRAGGRLADREHRIRGIWQEWQHGYQLEMRLPLGWAQEQFGLSFLDATASGGQWHSNFPTDAVPPPLMTRNPELDSALAVFTGKDSAEGTLLRLASPQAWLIAEAGQHAQPEIMYRLEGNRLLTRIYRLALGNQDFPAINNPRSAGRFNSSEVTAALAGDSSARWYQNQGQQVVRVAVPVRRAGTPVAAVVAEQTTDTLRAMTDSAFSRLVSYSLIAFAVAGLGLLTYASWLSWRIRRLSIAAEQAVDDNGRINRAFPQSRSQDEIGDLSRRYGELLERLRQYNSYLESLASKLSHELRTPLAVVRSSLDNLEHEQLSPQATTYSARAKDGAERLSGILTAMSAASRVEQSISCAELEPVDLEALLRELVVAYEDVYPHVNWHFSTDCHNCKLLAAPDLLVQMLDKLADNAADFCPTGQTVEITLREQAQCLTIDVSNPGPLLPAHMQGQLFDSLVSIRDSQTEGHHHLGLGLHIVRLIADFHRGKVAASNRADGSGVVFSASLPNG